MVLSSLDIHRLEFLPYIKQRWSSAAGSTLYNFEIRWFESQRLPLLEVNTPRFELLSVNLLFAGCGC